MGLISINEWFKIQDHLESIDLERLQQLLGLSKVDSLRKYKSLLETLKMLQTGSFDLEPLTSRYKYYDDIEEMTFAQFISIESSLQNIRDARTVYILVCSELLRPLSEKVYDNDDELRNIAHREAIGDEAAPYIFKLFNDFMKHRSEFHYKKYKDVFLYESEDGSQPDYDSSTQFYRNWHWYSYVRELSGEDISRYEQTMLMPMKVIAPEISYRQGLAKVEKQRMAEQQAIAKTKMRR